MNLNMKIMPSNNAGMYVGYLAGKHPGRIGWLISPGSWKNPPSWMPYALDNGAFSAHINNTAWDEGAFRKLLESARLHFKPLWVVVPDVVMDAEATKKKWQEWAPIIKSLMPTVKLAFAVQDGMTPCDVPDDCDVIFVGGSTEWKFKTLRDWTTNFKRVHVGRVNSERKLWQCMDAGVESCDGTGWLRGGEGRMQGLEKFLRETTNGDRRTQITIDIF